MNTFHLRPTYFMENTFGYLGMIRASGIMGSPVRPDLRMNMIATKDIAAYAAKRLLALDFRGHNVQYLVGQRDLTYNEVATVYGAALGKPDLRYVFDVEFDIGDIHDLSRAQQRLQARVRPHQAATCSRWMSIRVCTRKRRRTSKVR